MSEPCLYEKIESDIKGLISSGNILSGEKVPSVSEIRGKYSVSHITALRVLKELSDSGYVEFVKGKGYFARTFGNQGNTSVLKGVIGCILRPSWKSNPFDNYFNDINQAVQQESMKRKLNIYQPCCNIELLTSLPAAATLATIEQSCLEISGNVDGYLIDERIPDQIVRELAAKTGKPLVVVGRKSQAPADSVAPDNEGGSAKAAELCLRMGYECFIVGRNRIQNFNSSERTDAFLKGLADNGIKKNMIEFFDFNLLPYEETFAEIRRKMKKNVKTLFFSPHDSFARALADMLASENLRFRDDIGVMGFDGIGYSKVKKPFITTVDVRPELIGATAVGILAGRINGTYFYSPQCHIVESEIQIGDTI